MVPTLESFELKKQTTIQSHQMARIDELPAEQTPAATTQTEESSSETATPAQASASAPGAIPSDMPFSREQNALMDLTRSVLNPNGDDPRVDQYITSCFGYISSVLHKMSVSTNREETAKEVAQDLNAKFESWVAGKEKEKAEKEKAEKAEKETAEKQPEDKHEVSEKNGA